MTQGPVHLFSLKTDNSLADPDNKTASMETIQGQIGTITVNFAFGDARYIRNDVIYPIDWTQKPQDVRQDIPRALTTAFLANVPAITLPISWTDVLNQGTELREMTITILDSVQHAAQRTRHKPFTLTLFSERNNDSSEKSWRNGEIAHDILTSTFILGRYYGALKPQGVG